MTYQNHTHQGFSWTVMCPYVRKTYCMWVSESASSWMAHNNFKLEFGHWSWDWRKWQQFHNWHCSQRSTFFIMTFLSFSVPQGILTQHAIILCTQELLVFSPCLPYIIEHGRGWPQGTWNNLGLSQLHRNRLVLEQSDAVVHLGCSYITGSVF